jgi:hypothetical protein
MLSHCYKTYREALNGALTRFPAFYYTPLRDGGEGFAEALMEVSTARDAAYEEHKCEYGFQPLVSAWVNSTANTLQGGLQYVLERVDYSLLLLPGHSGLVAARDVILTQPEHDDWSMRDTGVEHAPVPCRTLKAAAEGLSDERRRELVVRNLESAVLMIAATTERERSTRYTRGIAEALDAVLMQLC